MEVSLMRKTSGFIAGPITTSFLKNEILKLLTKCAYADGGNEPDDDSEDDPPADNQVNYEDLIAKARKQEKDKQYKTIEKLRTTNTLLTNQHNEDLVAIATLNKTVDELNAKLTSVGSGDSEATKTLKADLEKLTKEKEKLEQKIQEYEKVKPVDREAIEAEIRAELEAEYEVKTYRATKLAELGDQILVPELIMGNTVEDLEASIQTAIERSNQIRKSLGITTEEESTKKKKKTPSSNPAVNNNVGKYTIDEIQNMDVNSPEYQEFRKSMGLR